MKLIEIPLLPNDIVVIRANLTPDEMTELIKGIQEIEPKVKIITTLDENVDLDIVAYRFSQPHLGFARRNKPIPPNDEDIEVDHI